MDISLEQQDGEWYKSLPHSGGVYDLIYTAVSGSGTADRLRAVVALGKSGDPRAVRPLVDLLGDTDQEIRLAATKALGSLKSGRPVDELVERLQDRSEQMVIREQAAVALARYTEYRRSPGTQGVRGRRDMRITAIRSFAGDLLKDTGAL